MGRDPWANPPGHRKRRSPADSGNNSKDCCPMAAAVQSVKHGKLRLAARYARLSVRLIVARSSVRGGAA